MKMLDAYSYYEGDNVWDLASLFINAYIIEDENYLQGLSESLAEEGIFLWGIFYVPCQIVADVAETLTGSIDTGNQS